MKIVAFFLFLLLTSNIQAKTAAEWRSRNIYQILTDRFARTDGSTAPCNNLSQYCGGTFEGIVKNLDYIQDLGFDAIWISPIVANIDGGYHGYWAKDIFKISPEFGGPEGLRALIKACHDRDIWVMVDIVTNHMGPMTRSDHSDKIPFNDNKYYHTNVDCSQIDPHNQEQLETCWLAQLPDLKTEDSFIKSTWLTWILGLVKGYNLDGLRIDTVPYVSKSFWKDFNTAAAVYTLGEVFDGNMQYVQGYEGYLDSLLNYPLYFSLRSVFQESSSMHGLESYFKAASWSDPTIVGNFVDNHDNARFLHRDGDQVAFKSALAFVLGCVGIPVTYYGSEQAYGGGNDPLNREPLWTNMRKGTDIYNFLKTINHFRKSSEFWKYPQVQRYADHNFYAFSRGHFFFAFTNTKVNQVRNITYHPYPDETELCNIFYASDCVKVELGKFPVYLNNGEVKFFAPKPRFEEQIQL